MLRVLVVEDSAVARRALVRTLESDPEIQVVGEATDGAHAVALVAQLKPDVVTAKSYTVCWKGVVSKVVCTSGAKVCW